EMLRLAGHARHGQHASAAEGADEAPAQLLKESGIDCCIGTNRQQQKQAAGQTAQEHRWTSEQLISSQRAGARNDYSRFPGAPSKRNCVTMSEGEESPEGKLDILPGAKNNAEKVSF